MLRAMAKRPAFRGQLGSQLGSILSRTWQQLDGVREVVEKRVSQGRVQLDLALLRRKRKDVLAALGAETLRLARAGRLDEEDFPELMDALGDVEEIEEKIAREESRSGDEGDDDYARGGHDDDDDGREEYDEDEADARGGEFNEDAADDDRARAAAGRRLRGEIDYDAEESTPVLRDDDDDLDDDDDAPARDEIVDDDDDDDDVAPVTAARREDENTAVARPPRRR